MKMYLVLQNRNGYAVAIWKVPALDQEHVQELMRMQDGVRLGDTFDIVWIPRSKRIYK